MSITPAPLEGWRKCRTLSRRAPQRRAGIFVCDRGCRAGYRQQNWHYSFPALSVFYGSPRGFDGKPGFRLQLGKGQSWSLARKRWSFGDEHHEELRPNSADRFVSFRRLTAAAGHTIGTDASLFPHVGSNRRPVALSSAMRSRSPPSVCHGAARRFRGRSAWRHSLN